RARDQSARSGHPQRLRTLSEINRHRDTGLGQTQPGANSERLEGNFKIARTLRKMPPTFGMNWNDDRIGKGARGLNRVVGIHREIKGGRASARRPRTAAL